MIYNSNCQPSIDNREDLPHKKSNYPYICQYGNMDNYIRQTIPYHWHSSLELDYIDEGEALLHTADETVSLKKGDAIFINTNVIHSIQAKCFHTKIFAHIFDASFLSGIPGSLLGQKYLLPVTENTVFKIHRIRPDSYKNMQMLEKIIEMIELNKKEPFGYELKVRAALSLFWCMFLEETKCLKPTSSGILKENPDVERIKLMIQYIESHYMEKITLSHIAGAANISSRECTRCFQKNLEISPMKFLTDYRVNIAAQRLIQTSDSILLISEECGFSSGSYFGKIFFDIMNCTPSEYRKIHSTEK